MTMRFSAAQKAGILAEARAHLRNAEREQAAPSRQPDGELVFKTNHDAVVGSARAPPIFHKSRYANRRALMSATHPRAQFIFVLTGSARAASSRAMFSTMFCIRSTDS